MNENLLKSLAVGVFGAAALVLLGPSLAAGAKPIVRSGIKAAVKGYAQSMEALAELQEMAEDAYAEAVAELQEEAAARTQAAAEPSADASETGKETPVAAKSKKRASA